MISDYDAINPALLGIHSLEIDILRASCPCFGVSHTFGHWLSLRWNALFFYDYYFIIWNNRDWNEKSTGIR
jgi:hypothetical protein